MRVISIFLFLSLISCSKSPYIYLPTPVKYPSINIPEKMDLPINNISEMDNPKEIIEAYVQTVRLLIIDNSDLRDRLSSYKHQVNN